MNKVAKGFLWIGIIAAGIIVAMFLLVAGCTALVANEIENTVDDASTNTPREKAEVIVDVGDLEYWTADSDVFWGSENARLPVTVSIPARLNSPLNIGDLLDFEIGLVPQGTVQRETWLCSGCPQDIDELRVNQGVHNVFVYFSFDQSLDRYDCFVRKDVFKDTLVNIQGCELK